ncbi:hypothetical protein HMPREF9089_00139 [Eubacterium brachy ATCC 33089]|jgi:hypothetical protein|nr:hypothetical protein HMPREF9089_00139 [Eubacterium brachy ATCC 33089]
MFIKVKDKSHIRNSIFIRSSQMSDSIFLGIVLALAGGFMDAYSYISRGQVFSNGQTGNLLLFGVNLASGNFYVSFHYIVPVIAFASGIALSEVIHIVAYKRNEKFLSDTSKDSDNVCNKSVETSGRRPSRLMPSFSMLSFHWRQVSILIEAVIIILVAFVPVGENQLANSLTSLACGIQVESFRRIHNRNIATAMCVGNMRTAVESLCSYYYHREPSVKKTFLIYSSAIFFFIVGAILGNFCINLFSERAMLVCGMLLLIGFLIMFIDLEKAE